MSFFEQLAASITKPSKYFALAKDSLRHKNTYIIVTAIIMSIMTFVIPAAAVIAGFGGFNNLFSKSMPAMSFEDGVFKASKHFDMEISSVHFYVDTSKEAVTMTDEMSEEYALYINFGSKKYSIIMSQGDEGNVTLASGNLTEILPEGFDNDMLVQTIPLIYAGLFFDFLVVAIGKAINYMIYSLILMIFVLPIIKKYDNILTVSECFYFCYFAVTFAMLVESINQALGYLIPSFIVLIIGFFFTVRCIFKAIASLDSTNAEPS